MGSQVSQIAPLPAPFEKAKPKWGAPTKEALGDEESVCSSYVSSVRTATTIREFFDEEDRWAGGSSRCSRGPRPPKLPASHCITPQRVAGVLPGVPEGKIPGGRPAFGPSRHDLLYRGRPLTGTE